jgi:hypothetical protein
MKMAGGVGRANGNIETADFLEGAVQGLHRAALYVLGEKTQVKVLLEDSCLHNYEKGRKSKLKLWLSEEYFENYLECCSIVFGKGPYRAMMPN